MNIIKYCLIGFFLAFWHGGFVSGQMDKEVKRLSVNAGLSGQSMDIWTSQQSEPIEISPSAQSTYYSLLKLKPYRERLELTDQQVREINEMYMACDQSIRSLAKTYEESPVSSRHALVVKSNQISRSFDESIGKILMPHQVSAIKYSLAVSVLRRRGFLRALTEGSLGQKLELSDTQRTKISSKITDMEKKLDGMKKEFLSSVVSTMTAEQKTRLEDILGDDFQSELFKSAGPLVSEIESFARLSGKRASGSRAISESTLKALKASASDN